MAYLQRLPAGFAQASFWPSSEPQTCSQPGFCRASGPAGQRHRVSGLPRRTGRPGNPTQPPRPSHSAAHRSVAGLRLRPKTRPCLASTPPTAARRSMNLTYPAASPCPWRCLCLGRGKPQWHLEPLTQRHRQHRDTRRWVRLTGRNDNAVRFPRLGPPRPRVANAELIPSVRPRVRGCPSAPAIASESPCPARSERASWRSSERAFTAPSLPGRYDGSAAPGLPDP